MFSPILTVILTSLIAGLATAPIAAAHFNQIVHYGLIANILSVPVMGALVAPGAILSVSLMPFGAEIIGLWIVDIGLGWILKVATFLPTKKMQYRVLSCLKRGYLHLAW
ncbi:MAG: ComEC/Rec2 family competence protein [Paracoccaceae bacterium]